MSDEGDSLRKLIADERQCLRTGQYDRLAQIGAEKTRLLGAIKENPPSAQELATLHEMLRHNARLIAAAVDGFRETGHRVADLRQNATGFASYCADGRAATISAGSRPCIERRA